MGGASSRERSRGWLRRCQRGRPHQRRSSAATLGPGTAGGARGSRRGDRARGLCRGVVKKLQKPSRTTTTMIILVAFAVLNKLLEPMGCKAEG